MAILRSLRAEKLQYQWSERPKLLEAAARLLCVFLIRRVEHGEPLSRLISLSLILKQALQVADRTLRLHQAF